MPSSVTSSEHPRVLLVDDNETLLHRAAAVLSPGCAVIGAVTEGEAALEIADTMHPDVIVLDISMPGMDGFEVAARLKHAGSTAAVVFLTVHDDEEVMHAAAATGAIGYVLKRRLATDLTHAVVEARAGRRFVSDPR